MGNDVSIWAIIFGCICIVISMVIILVVRSFGEVKYVSKSMVIVTILITFGGALLLYPEAFYRVKDFLSK